MATLILARHAKAERPTHGLDDHERELLPEGVEAAMRLGERLAELGLVPDLILASSAARAKQTADALAAAFPGVQLRVEDDLYDAARERYLSVVMRAGDVQTVVVVGHEPTTSHVAAYLAGPGSLKQPLQRMAHGMPTAGAAVFELDVAWSALEARSARLVNVIEGKPL